MKTAIHCLVVAALVQAPLAAQEACFSWKELGGGLGHTATSPTVWELTTFDDGSGEKLYAAGSFSSAGSLAVRNIACWDGSSWSDVGGGVDGQVEALYVFDDDGPGPNDPALYVGGLFSDAGGVAVNNLARWNGTSWSDVGGGVNGLVSALVAFDVDGAGPNPARLFAGGGFFTAGGNTAVFVASWDGSAWSPLGSGTNNLVTSLEVYDDGGGEDLYVGGFFAVAGGVPANFVARWDGAAWSGLAAGTLVGHPTFTSGVWDLHVHDDGGGRALYAGGLITSAGGLPATGIARFDGSAWRAVGDGFASGYPIAMLTFDDGYGDALFAGGGFVASGPTALANVARWDGTAWLPVGVDGGMNKSVLAMTSFDAGAGETLIAGGIFTQAGTSPADALALANRLTDPIAYCTAKQNSAGCTPTMSWTGCPSATSSAPFELRAGQVVNGRLGLLCYGLAANNAPFFGGVSCVGAPVRRVARQNSGGAPKPTNDCSGSLVFDMNARIRAAVDPNLIPGARVFAQYLYRDPLDFGRPVGSTDAIDFTIHP